MPREDLADLAAHAGRAVQSYQSAVDAFDGAVAERLGVNRTDLRCLEILLDGAVAPGLLGKKLGLTSGSVTAMVDRLEKLGHAARSADPADRRKVVVSITAEARQRLWEIYGPLAEEGAQGLAHFTAPQLHAVIDYLDRGRRLYQDHLDRLHHTARTN